MVFSLRATGTRLNCVDGLLFNERCRRVHREHGSGNRLQGSYKRSALDTPVTTTVWFESTCASDSNAKQAGVPRGYANIAFVKLLTSGVALSTQI